MRRNWKLRHAIATTALGAAEQASAEAAAAERTAPERTAAERAAAERTAAERIEADRTATDRPVPRGRARQDFARRQEEATEWVQRLSAPDVTAEERRIFAGWLASDPAHAAAFHRAKRLHWMASHPLTPQDFHLHDAPPKAANSIDPPAPLAAARSELLIGPSATGGLGSPHPKLPADAPSPDSAPALDPVPIDPAPKPSASHIHQARRATRRGAVETFALQQRAMRQLTADHAGPATAESRIEPRDQTSEPPRGQSAAIIIAASLAALALFLLADGPMRLRADLIAGSHEMPRLTLPDGSVLQLDAGSAVDIAYDVTERRIRLLRGEAFFEIARDVTRPFVVEAQGGTVTAGMITDDTGTPSSGAFDLRLTRNGAEVTAAGQRISVAPPDKADGDQFAPVLIDRGQQISYGADGSIGTVRPADALRSASWRFGQLNVDGETLSSVVDRIARHSATPVVILGDALAKRRISGSFDLKSPQAALDALATQAGIRISHIGPLLTILHD